MAFVIGVLPFIGVVIIHVIAGFAGVECAFDLIHRIVSFDNKALHLYIECDMLGILRTGVIQNA
jgi:hypothetical protein